MTQQRWSVRRYQAPYLDVETIERLNDSVRVRGRHVTLDLDCFNADGTSADLMKLLSGLRDPDHELWGVTREGCYDESDHVEQFLSVLDCSGFVRDSVGLDPTLIHAEIERAVDEWIACVASDAEQVGEGAFELLARVTNQLDSTAMTMHELLLEESLFPILSLRLQARFLRAYAPGILGVLIVALRAAVIRGRAIVSSARQSVFGAIPPWAEEDWVCGLVDPTILRQYLRVTRHLLRDAYSPTAARRVRGLHPSVVVPVSGINFILDVEGEVTQLLAELGPSPIVAAMTDIARAKIAVKCAFLQEYLVTCRFVESIAPLLARQFTAPLREAVHQYFTEEIGHEEFERRNCCRLGMTEQELDRAELLPLHMIFVDVLTNAARESPLCFFCSSMFTEGLVGAQHSLVSLAQEAFPENPHLIDALSEHVAVNEKGDHRSVGRDWMSRVPLVAPRVQSQIREWIAYLTELNWRMWEQLVRSSD